MSKIDDRVRKVSQQDLVILDVAIAVGGGILPSSARRSLCLSIFVAGSRQKLFVKMINKTKKLGNLLVLS